MNKARRARLNAVINGITDLKETLEEILGEEQDALDNMPESLEGTERYEKIEEAVDSMENAVDELDDVIEYLETAME